VDVELKGTIYVYIILRFYVSKDLLDFLDLTEPEKSKIDIKFK
jgi:hypothetical protein